ncbi:MAG: N-acetylmuramoyl-L-alanine amidase [Muribaculaceae bacterium]
MRVSFRFSRLLPLLAAILTIAVMGGQALYSAETPQKPRTAKSSKSAKKEEPHRFTVIVDAGHGGRDFGCVGKRANEKTINLDVARRLAHKIEDGCADTRVVLTRDGDYFLTLQQRANIANREKGDLFISIHVNSVARKSPGRTAVHGTSVYALGADKAEKNMGVAMRENAVMELEDDYSTAYRGFDPNSTESYIIFELSSNMHLHRSLDFAALAQDRLVNYAGRADKGVRQAGFWVLWATSMPAVLVELDYICNPEAEKYLDSDDGREQCAEALFRAVRDYRNGNAGKATAMHR